ncbi:MAG: metal-dependent hydrolase [Flavobacteriales bacterium]|nr:metal-dependent hydrolase [Flavobacteriales bacterium]
MDILTHTISGTAAGVVIASFSTGSLAQRAGIILVGTIAGTFPDLDVLSAWSGFDDSFGSWFNLNESGRQIFKGNHWYSHHGAFHSLTFAIIIPMVANLAGFLWKKRIRRQSVKYRSWIKRKALFMIAFTLGMTFHCIEDMLTPPGPWDGIAFYWPHPEYIGGWGKIWWWNSYDLFLIVLGSIFLNSLILLFAKRIHVKAKSLAPVVLGLAMILFIMQVNNRRTDYSNFIGGKDYPSFEEQSLKYQEEILGPTVYEWMVRFDESLPVMF